jgi:CRP/FNR family transcriptional regulator, dissimilatory nitrate respiration regulator
MGCYRAYMIMIMLEHLAKLRQSERIFEPGQFLFHRDDPVKFMFLIVAGSAHLIRRGARGNALILQRASTDSIPAEASLFSTAYHCDAIAASKTVAKLMSKSAMQQLFYKDREFAKAWSMHLAAEVRHARRRAEILSIKTVAEKIDAWIADCGHPPEKGSWKLVAQEIGVSPEAFYREMATRR